MKIKMVYLKFNRGENNVQGTTTVDTRIKGAVDSVLRLYRHRVIYHIMDVSTFTLMENF